MKKKIFKNIRTVFTGLLVLFPYILIVIHVVNIVFLALLCKLIDKIMCTELCKNIEFTIYSETECNNIYEKEEIVNRESSECNS